VRGIRTRLALALVALVAVTVTAIGVGTYAYVESRLRDGLLGEASRQAQFNLSVLIPDRLPDGVTRESYGPSGLVDAFRLRGDVETVVDYRDGDAPDASTLNLLELPHQVPSQMRVDIDAGRLAFSWQPVDGLASLVIGGRSQPGGPDFYFVFPAATIEAALDQLRLGLVVAGLLAVLLALAAAGVIARGILRPVDSGSAAAARIAAGDLSARVPVGGADEFARFAAEFNHMADSLAASVARLEESEGRNRRFVADVAHELRTPLTALVAEASIIEAGLAELSPDARRAAELLVADVRRLRLLVDDLMELSRFDARAEQAVLEPVEVVGAVRSIVASRAPDATVTGPDAPVMVDADIRRLDRIVGNLLDNARVHAPEAPVEVSIEAEGGWVVVTVADRGPGVPPAALSHVFDRFFKADASRHGGSSGLGLAIAAEHAELLGGSLSAANRPGGGLAVTLRLPVTRSLPVREGADMNAREAGSRSSAEPAPTESARPNA
jgi:two-component system, OmpR family, sensor histidine kinase MtrB